MALHAFTFFCLTCSFSEMTPRKVRLVPKYKRAVSDEAGF